MLQLDRRLADPRLLILAALRAKRRAALAPPDALALMRRAGLEPDAWQQGVLTSEAPRALWLCSRQVGKSTCAAALALAQAVQEPGSLTLLLSPSLRQSQEIFHKVLELYRPLAAQVPAEQISAMRMTLSGSRIISLPGTEQTIRGYSGVRLLIVDEAARVDDALYLSVRPMLSVSGGRLVALSSAWGKTGWFYEAWTQGDAWERVTVTAYECPRIPASFLEEERVAMPLAWYQSEYECVFGDLVNAVFRGEDIDAMFRGDAEPWFPEGV